MTKKKLLDDKKVNLALAQLTDEVVEEVVTLACKIAKHRGARRLEKQDVKFAFEKRYKVKIPQKLHNSKEAILQQPVQSTQNYRTNLQLVKKELDRAY